MILSLVQLDCLYTVRTGLPVGLDGGISAFLFESVAVVVVAGWHACFLLPPLDVGLPARVWLGHTATISQTLATVWLLVSNGRCRPGSACRPGFRHFCLFCLSLCGGGGGGGGGGN